MGTRLFGGSGGGGGENGGLVGDVAGQGAESIGFQPIGEVAIRVVFADETQGDGEGEDISAEGVG